ncbi:MAG: MFS transporter, partial [Chloroflexota bacterium]
GAPVLLLLLLFIRRRPRDLGLFADGEPDQPANPAGAAPRRSLRVVNAAWAERRWTLGSAMRTYQFWALFAANFLVWGVSFSLVTTHHAAYARDSGHSAGLVALMLGVYGIANLVGALCGFLSDRWGREVTYSIGAAIACLGLVALIFAGDPSREWLLLSYSVLCAFGLGLLAPAMSATHADLFQGPHFGAINGLIVTGFALGATLSPWAAGYIYDNFNSYLPSFLFSIACIVGACAAIWVARPSAVRSVFVAPGGR